MIRKAILLVCVPVLVLGLAALADWQPEDGHKMHWPQLPDETGWAVNATQPLILADDFRCMETGWIKDVHFWGAWRHGDEGQVTTFWLSLHADIPADQNPDGYSKPGETLREWEITDWDVVPIDPPTMEGWFDPATNDTFPEDHYAYFQYNVFLPEADWFHQDSGTIYWLNISAIVQDPANTQWGWKSTQDHWNDDAVWAEWGDLSWEEMYEPEEPVDTLINDFNIFIDPAGNFQGGSGGGAHPPGWVLYPDDWWTIWYYDHPLDTNRFKEVLLEYEIYMMDPGQPSLVEIAINWSNEEWPDETAPPDPAQNQFIQRAIVYAGPVVSGNYTFPFEILEYNPVWVSVDVRGYNFEIPMGYITHICHPKGPVSLDLSFVITGGDGVDTCDFYKSPYLDYVPQGMPDFDMKQLAAWTGDAGRWTHDGPAALANCIWWFDSKFETGLVDPRPFWPGPGNPPLSDNYPLLSTYDPVLQWDDHDTNNVQPFIDDLANNYLNTGALGTYPMDMINGFRTYLNTMGMDPDYRDSAQAGPSYEFIRDEVLTSQDVILLLGFYEDMGTGYSNYLGGHWVTTAGICTHDRIICISDPYLDALEGEPPAGSAHGPTLHNDADNISGPHSQIQHDPYTCTSTTPPGWTLPVEVVNYPTTAATIAQFNGMNAYSDPGAYGGGPLFVVIDMAYVICPVTDTGTCEYYKDPYNDYAPVGMPDFDQKQDQWTSPITGNWSYCGPVALANCIWWFDSKFEPNPVPPTPFFPSAAHTPNDGYGLLTSFEPAGLWDDHDTNNVMPFVQALAGVCNTDGGGPGGTVLWDLEAGFQQWLIDQGMAGDYSTYVVLGPEFDEVRDSVLSCQDVILLIGFYELIPGEDCQWIGGHYVTAAGVCTTSTDICVSDPMFDGNEGEPPAGSAHGSWVHNDAALVSGPHGSIDHDRYNLVPNPYTCLLSPATWAFTDYPSTWPEIMVFEYENPIEPDVDWPVYMGNEIVALLDAALIICPVEDVDTCEYYKPPYDDYSPYGMPDFDQKQDLWIYPPSGAWSYCGPVALANCFWWFDSKFEPSPVIPTPFYPGPGNPAANDGYNLVYSFDPGGVWDDHDTNNVMPFVDSMALYCLTNSSGSGTNVFDLAQGAQDWIDSVGLSGKYTVNLFPVDPAFGFDQIRDEVLISQDVILLLGFYEDFGGNCERVGGHFVTVAGTCTDPLDSALCISDPYFDMHEGEPPAGSAHASGVHNDAANISGPHGTMHHDKYWVTPNTCPLLTPPFFDCELPGYPVNAGNVPVWYGQNNPDPSIDPVPPQGGPIHTIIEYAVIICPDTTPPPTGACCEPPYGLCHIMTQFSCDSAGWFYEGDGTTCTPNPCDSCDYQSPGDVDNDGNINVADIAYLISFLYKGGPAPPVMANADPNGDCCIDYRDVLYLIQFVFFAGPPPVNCTCVDPPVCIPAPGTYVPGIVKHNTDGYLPTDGSPIGTNWHELFPGYCENWTCSSWVDNGDGILSYCDTLDFYHPVYGVKTLEHVELVTPTIELINTVDPFDTLYLDLIDPPNATCTTITEPIGTRWHEVYPQYCHQFMIVYHGGLNFMSPLAVSDMIIIQSLNGADSGTSYETYMVTDIDCDIVTTPLITLGDEYDHNVDGYSPYSGSPEGSLWQELYPNFDDMWIVDKWIDNGDGWLSFCDTIKVVGQDPPYPVRWKHVKELTYTLTCTDPANDTFYFDYRMLNPVYPWSSAPVGTFWHELYPTFSQMTWCINWIDNGTGFVDFCDSLDLEYLSGPDSGTVVRFHVESIDWDMVSTIEEYWNPPPPMDGKFKHNIDGWHLSDANPEGSLWHELWFNYCETWRCSLWIDNGNMVLDYCDTLVFRHEPTGRLSYEHVQVVTPTITITKADTTWYLDGLDPNPLIYPVTAPVGGYWQLVYPRNSWFGLPYQITAWNDNGNGFLDSCDYIDFRDEWGNVHSDWHVVAFETDIITDPLPNPNVDEYDHNLDGYFPADGDPTGTYWHELYPNYCDLWQIEEWRDNGDDVLSFCDTLKFRGEIMEDSVLWKHVEEVTGTLVLVPEEAGDTTYMDMMCGRPTAEPLTMAEGPLGTIFHEVYPTFCRRFLWQGWGDNGNGVLDAGDQVAMRSILPPDSGTVHLFMVVDWQTDIMTTIIPAPSCCIPPLRGNVDMDALDQIDISDLVYLVDYMFTGGPAPVCTEEADMNCSGGGTPIDIADLVYLVDYMFNQGPAPCRCDCSDCP